MISAFAASWGFLIAIQLLVPKKAGEEKSGIAHETTERDDGQHSGERDHHPRAHGDRSALKIGNALFEMIYFEPVLIGGHAL